MNARLLKPIAWLMLIAAACLLACCDGRLIAAVLLYRCAQEVYSAAIGAEIRVRCHLPHTEKPYSETPYTEAAARRSKRAWPR